MTADKDTNPHQAVAENGKGGGAEGVAESIPEGKEGGISRETEEDLEPATRRARQLLVREICPVVLKHHDCGIPGMGMI